MNASSHQVLETSKPDCQPKGFTNDTKRARRTRPSPYPYRWHNLLLLPQRIRHPRSCAPKGWQDPTLDCPVEAGIESDTCDKQEWHQKTTTTTVIDTAFKVGKPRTLAKTPVNQITLRDVLEGRHLPPLTRDEFTDYLAYEELSVENYYFYAWLEGYTAQYEEWLASRAKAITSPEAAFAVTSDNYDRYVASYSTPSADRRDPQTLPEDGAEMTASMSVSPADLPLHLSQSWYKAFDAFFREGSRFQLNLDEDVSVRTRLDALHSPDPSVFRPAKEAVETMLTNSLNKFLREISGNAGRYRSIFAVALGTCVVLIGFLPFILALCLRWPRAVRAACIPLFFFGTLTAIGGLRRTCIVLWLFGTCRQLRMCEMARPAALAASDSDGTGTKAFIPSINTLVPPPSQVITSRRKHVRASSMTLLRPTSRPSLTGTLLPSTRKLSSTTVVAPGERKQSASTLINSDAFVSSEAVPTPLLLPVLLEQTTATSMLRTDSSEGSQVSGDSQKREDAVKSVTALDLPSAALSMEGVTSFETPDGYFGKVMSWQQPWEEMETEGMDVYVGDTARQVSKTQGKRDPAPISTKHSVSVFAPMTQVFSPHIAVFQTQAILRGAKYGLCVSLILGAIVLAVP